MTDQDIWVRLKSGDKDALAQIYQDHVDFLISYGSKFTSDQQTVEDVIQDLFIEIWQKRESIGNTDAIRPYLLVSIRRKIIKVMLKKNKNQVDKTPEEVDFEVEIAIDELIARQEETGMQALKINEGLSQLSARQKEALYLKYYQDLDYEKICEIMDISYQSARNLVAKGIKAMRKLLAWLIWILIVVN